MTLVLPLDEDLPAFVLCEELELLGVDGTATPLTDEFDRILVLHAQLDEGHGHEDGGTSQPGHAVDTDADITFILEFLVDQGEPFVHDFLVGGGSVREGELGHGDP